MELGEDAVPDVAVPARALLLLHPAAAMANAATTPHEAGAAQGNNALASRTDAPVQRQRKGRQTLARAASEQGAAVLVLRAWHHVLLPCACAPRLACRLLT